MPRSLFLVGRSSRTGIETTSSFVLPADDGVIVASLDIVASQMTDPARRVHFAVQVELTPGAWETISAGQWQGNPSGLTPTEEVPMVGGGLDFRGKAARWVLEIPQGSPPVNVGGRIEWFGYGELQQARANN